jgi:hypothetical protein
MTGRIRNLYPTAKRAYSVEGNPGAEMTLIFNMLTR